MSDFKLKINLGSANIELEGEGELVKEIFTDLKSNGLGKLSNNITSTILQETQDNLAVTNNIETFNTVNTLDVNIQEDENYPAIKDIVLRNLTKKETERVLVFAFYASKYGKNLVSKNDIKEQYSSIDLWTKSISGNFNTYIKSLIKDKYLSTYNEDYYNVTPKGIEKANSIVLELDVSDNSETKNNGKKRIKKISKYDEVGIDLNKDERKDLLDFFIKYTPKNNIDKVILVAFWLNKNKNIKFINRDIIFTILKNANISTVFSIKDALSNAKKKNYLFASNTRGEFELSHIGEDYLSNEILIEAQKADE